MPLGDCKPSQLWRLMCNEMSNIPHEDAFVRELWLQTLPQNIQLLLAPAQDMPTERLTVMADHAMQYHQPTVTPVTPTVPPATSIDGFFQAFITKLSVFSTDRKSSDARNRALAIDQGRPTIVSNIVGTTHVLVNMLPNASIRARGSVNPFREKTKPTTEYGVIR
ncbi:unnamed protein product [Echinostoma caproni]|uniref:Uncharacterized protein n=1 Tax=Echinostoma caproni TaxID=27848 RepID=A0A183BDF0_9TREM|nr:unnamed protein product [Echinostoma caproni]